MFTFTAAQIEVVLIYLNGKLLELRLRDRSLIKINFFQTSSTTKTTTMTTPAKLYGKDLGEYEEMDVDELLSQLSPEEINILAKEVDPDVSRVVMCVQVRLC